jgi:hypothetical protein
MRWNLVVCLLVLFCFASVGSAQYVEIYRIDQLAKDLSEDQVLGAAATSLGVSRETLKQEKAQYKATSGELYIAHQMARAGKLDFKALMAEARAGKAWGVLAKEKNVDMDPVSKSVREFEDALKKVQRAGK